MSKRLPRHIRDDPHIRLWANFFDDPDVDKLHPLAQNLYLRMACKSRQLRSDGLVHERHVAKLGLAGWRAHVDALTHAGLLAEFRDHDGQRRWHIVAYPKWNKCETDYQRDTHNGRLGGCVSKHPQPCERPDCIESRMWLDLHPAPESVRGG